jgi:hypothetical protein
MLASILCYLICIQDKARANNVSKEVVDNCIRRVVEGKEGWPLFVRVLLRLVAHILIFIGAIMETVFYEGTGPGGTAFMVSGFLGSALFFGG